MEELCDRSLKNKTVLINVLVVVVVGFTSIEQ